MKDGERKSKLRVMEASMMEWTAVWRCCVAVEHGDGISIGGSAEVTAGFDETVRYSFASVRQEAELQWSALDESKCIYQWVTSVRHDQCRKPSMF